MNGYAVESDKLINALLKPVYEYLYLDGVDEITINKPNKIWLKFGYKWESRDIELSYQDIEQIINALSSYNSMPFSSNLSLLMPNGERCQATLKNAVVDGYISFNVRKHSNKTYSLEELYDQGAFDSCRDFSFNKSLDIIESRKDQLSDDDYKLLKIKASGDYVEFLRQIVLTKKNVLIAGNTGSGKTTFMRSLVREIPEYERIITIEDVHELSVSQPNHLHLMMGDGKGRLPPQDALKACMRLSPDRILLAEIRGNEAYEYLNSLNTGHNGGMTTVHSNGALASFDRVATLIKNSEVGRGLDLSSIMMSLNTSIEVILFFKYRKLTEVYFDPLRSIDKNIINI